MCEVSSNKHIQVALPAYTLGRAAYDQLEEVVKSFGKKVVIVYGKTGFEKAKPFLMPKLEKSDLQLLDCVFYGGEASYECVEALKANPSIQEAEMLFAVGGGKCQDCVKVVAHQLRKAVFTFPTIAATCAAVTAISVMYDQLGAFKDVYHLASPPSHTFIHTQIIAEAPYKFLWAGIGDTMAKYFEVNFSSRGDTLDHSSELGRTISSLCYKRMLEYGYEALQSCKENTSSFALQDVVANIIVSTGLTSILVDPMYNSALAHALFYGLTIREHIEKQHLHGEVVAYGVLVQCVMDKQWDDLRELIQFYKQIELPICLNDLELRLEDELEDILIKTEQNPELNHVPYLVNKMMIKEAIIALESYQ